MLHFRPNLQDSQFKCVAASITEAQLTYIPVTDFKGEI